MVHFFGILKPGFGPRIEQSDAPFKAAFFGGANADSREPDPTRAELDIAFLTGKSPEPPAEIEDAAEDDHFVRLCFPPYF
jgi:hypothetical protein